MREDTEALLLGRGASKMCLGGPLLAAKNGLGWDHFWQGGTTFGCQKWSGEPLLVAKSGLGGPVLVPKSGQGDHFWAGPLLA